MNIQQAKVSYYLPHDDEYRDGDDSHVGAVWIKPAHMCPAASDNITFSNSHFQSSINNISQVW